MSNSLSIGSPIEYWPQSVATKADLLTVVNPKNLPLERYCIEDGKTYKYNPSTIEWEASSVSFVESDEYWQRIITAMNEKVAGSLKRVGSFTPIDAFPATGGSGTDGAILAANAWTITGLAAGQTIIIEGLTLKNGYIIYALADNPGQDEDNWDVIESAEMMMPDSHMWVHPIKGSDTHGDGTQHYPYATLKGAMVAKGTGSDHVVIHMMASMTEDVVVDDGYQNITIYGSPAVLDSQQRQLIGTFTINHASSTRLRMMNVIMNGKAATDDYVLKVLASAGRNYFHNTSFIPDAASSGKAVQFEGAVDRWQQFDSCYIGGELKCASTDTSMTIKIENQLAGEFKLNMSTDCLVWVYNVQRYNQFVHSAGKLLINGLYESWNTTDDDAIVSTATAAGSGLLEVLNAKLMDTGRAWKKINKTGDCDYLLGNIFDKSGLHTLTGIRLNPPQLRTKDIPVAAEDWTETSGVYELTIPRVDGHEFAVTKQAIMYEDDGSGNFTEVLGHVQHKINGDVYFNRAVDTEGQVSIFGY